MRPQTKIYRIAYKPHAGTKELIKRLPRGTSAAKAMAVRAKMAADPKNQYAELREEWK